MTSRCAWYFIFGSRVGERCNRQKDSKAWFCADCSTRSAEERCIRVTNTGERCEIVANVLLGGYCTECRGIIDGERRTGR